MDAGTWLGELGYRQDANGDWSGPELAADETSGNDVIHAVADALWYGDVPSSAAVELTLSLLTVVPDYAALMYLRMAWDRLEEQYRRRVMKAFLEILEMEDAERAAQREAVEYALWVDFFEDPRTQEWTFLQLSEDLASTDLPPSAVRRLRRLLPLTGPIEWSLKAPLYWAHCRDVGNAAYVFAGVLASYHDVYGRLENEDALRLLDELQHAVSGDDLLTLRRVLQAGNTNHYRDPEAWASAARAT